MLKIFIKDSFFEVTAIELDFYLDLFNFLFSFVKIISICVEIERRVCNNHFVK